MARAWWLLNGMLATVALGLVAGLVWDLAHARPLPPPPPLRAAAVQAVPAAPAGTDGRPPVASDAIATRNLFSASRTEVTAVVAAVPAGPKPVLHGVLINGDQSRAYLDDPAAKRVFGYAVGDTAGGGRIEQIVEDRVVIRRPEGLIDVLVQDPGKPKPAVSAPTTPGSPLPAPTAAMPTPGAPLGPGGAPAPRGPMPPGQPAAAPPAPIPSAPSPGPTQ
jgi:Type II secretion system protein C